MIKIIKTLEEQGVSEDQKEQCTTEILSWLEPQYYQTLYFRKGENYFGQDEDGHTWNTIGK